MNYWQIIAIFSGFFPNFAVRGVHVIMNNFGTTADIPTL